MAHVSHPGAQTGERDRVMQRKSASTPRPKRPRANPRASEIDRVVDRLAEERFRALLQDLNVGVALLGVHGEVQFANRAATDIFRVSPEEAIGRTTAQFTQESYRRDNTSYPFPLRPVPQAIRKREATGNEMVGYRRADSDELFWIFGSVVPQFAEDGSVRRVIAAFMDATSWKNAEDQLRESEERFRGAFEAAAVGMAMLAMSGRWLRANPSLCRILGYSEDELQRLTYQEITHPDDLPPGEELDRQLRERERSNFQMEKRYIHKNGTPVWVLISVSLVRDNRGEPLYYVTLTQDITHRKRAEKELHELSARVLASQEEERRRIARDLHDSFAQTLVAISLNLTELQKSAKLQRGHAARVLTETRRMVKGLARETRSLSYLLHPPLLEELGLVSATVEYARGFASRTGIQLELDLPEEAERMPHDVESALFRVIQEALGNIQKHSGSSKGRIRITLDGGQLVLEVSDEGRGMPSEASKGGREAESNLGVGILGMRERMRQLGGELDVLAGNPGTVVVAKLPLPVEGRDGSPHPHRG